MVSLAHRVLAQARRTPDEVAITDGDRTLTYAELDAASARAAAGLRDRGVRPGDAIAVRVPRSAELVCTMLGILRLGGTVVPLDTQSPPERRDHILLDSGSVALVHDGAAPDELPEAVKPFAVTEVLEAGHEPEIASASVAFVFYTSGTTGRPKGVEVTGDGILRLARPGYLERGERYSCLSNPAFDAISFEVWVPLLTGARCVILADEVVQTPELLADVLLRERIDTVWMTTALFNAVVDRVPHCFAGARQMVVGGEQLDAGTMRRWYQDNPGSSMRLHNVYGPTESTTYALSYPIPRRFDGDVVPIGRPLPGTTMRLVVDGEREAEPGEVAELYLGGEGLAAGYRNLPEETASRFVQYDGDRYYRTGDLVRADDGGLVSFVGRVDRQVKVRGFRVEPGEVERQLLRHPAVRLAHVCARREAGVHELVAYLVLGAEVAFAEFEQHLARTLPGYLRPHRIHLVDELPLNANSKVDERALLGRDLPAWRAEAADDRIATESERALLAVASAVLGVSGLRPGDRWVPSGGDSLKALRLRFEVRRRWGCELAQTAVLRDDFATLAAAVDAGTRTPYPAAGAPSGARCAPATSEQQRLWLLQQQAPESRAYDVDLAFRVSGAVDVDALKHAVRRLVVRYPALRTAFEARADGLYQVVADPYDPWEPATGPFDLARPRQLRARWDDGVLRLRLHHIAVDGWSVSVLLRAISEGYTGKATVDGVETRTPLDFAAWQAAWFAEPAYQAQRVELQAHYDGRDDLVAARSGSNAVGRLLCTKLDAAQRATADRLGAELGLTRFQLLLGVFAWSVYGVTGRTRPRIASPVANRPVQEFEDSVGMFANTVLVPLEVVPGEGLRAQLRQQAADTRAVLDRQDVALADLALPADGALFDYLFVLENTDFGALTLPGCPVSPEWTVPAEAKCALTMSVVDRADGLDCLWEFADDRFDAAEIEAMAELFRRGLDELDRGGATLAELVASYRRALPDPGRGAVSTPSFTTIADGFARQVRRTPDSPALAADGRTVSYAELDSYANALAAKLGAVAGPSVALYFEASVEHVVALLALARLNLTIVPLDPAYPPALLRQILDQAEPSAVLLAPGSEAALDEFAPADLPRHPVTLSTTDAPEPPPHQGERPLYTLFTSGSTGTPKGVEVTDGTLGNLLHWQVETEDMTAAATQQFSMLSFDVSFQEIFGTLCTGGTLHLAEPGWRHDAPALLAQLETAGIERLHLPYVALQLLAEHGVRLGSYPSRLREVVTAGEQLLCTDAIRRWFAGLPGACLVNHYGPTETHVVSSLRLEGDPANWPDRPAIGKPVDNTMLRVVDDADEILPPGRSGELLIGGPHVSPCYLGDAELNRARFVELPGLGHFFRSGDLARFDSAGLLHFLGRDDEQIKLSGYRLELGQVETALLGHASVSGAVVVRDGNQLVACLRCHGEVPSAAELADHLAGLLPAYARIDRFRVLEALPRTPSGKVDRRRVLAAPGVDLRSERAASPGLSAREAQLAAVFEGVVGQPIGPDQRFFDAGASSLGLMRFHLRCTGELGLALSIPDLFEHVTIRRLARFLDGDAPAERAAIAESAPDEPIAVVGMAVRLPGADDLGAFWTMAETGGRGIEHFDAEDGLVGARSELRGPLAFDPAAFGISRRDAALMDPQQRHLLMNCVEALAHAGIADQSVRSVGLVASCSENTYFQSMLREADPARLPDSFQFAFHHEKDFLATKVAYCLGLRGPAFTVQAACGSSLVGVHVAAGMLRAGDSEVMLVGGVQIDLNLGRGYRYRPQHIFSKDGHCRPFSDDASGTVGASGVGTVVLKPLRLARQDGDTVYAVITGSALNNDGDSKLSYSAPALAGQREVIRAALRRSGHTGADVGYVEAHGTGTELGDPVEVGALREAFEVAESGRCALSSVKSQLGHLGTAAGVVGLVRAALALHHGLIPPTVDFHELNPKIGDPGPFFVPAKAERWPDDRPRVAAVSSFGVGGTNAHVVLDEGDQSPEPAAGSPCLMLSSASAAGLRADATRIADYLEARPETFDQVLRHLQAGRPARRWRVAAVHADAASAISWLRKVSGVETSPTEEVLEAGEHRTGALVVRWLGGATVRWADGPAQAPWDFPPPAFDLADYDFDRAAPETAARAWPSRVPEAEWLHQPHWVRLRRAASTGAEVTGVVVVMTAEPVAGLGAGVVQVTAADSFARLADDRYQVDPADPESLRSLFDALGADAVHWVHALPLSIGGAVGEVTVARARWACVDTPAAVVRAAAAGPTVRTWWLSQQAQPVDGPVRRPELGLLAGITEVAPQESGADGHWVDLPSPDPQAWAPLLPALLSEPRLPRRLALRQGYWWHPALVPVTPSSGNSPVYQGVHLVLGGTGGIGTSIAAWLLARSDCRVVLLARRALLPDELAPWADRVDLLEADLGTCSLDAVLARLDRVDGVVHAAGVADGGTIAHRDPAGMRRAMAAKERGALLVERVIERFRPAFAVYCSSMSAWYGGTGQLDYAASNGLLDGFARARSDESETTARLVVDWDIWAETGMAPDVANPGVRHRAHLAVGLSAAEGQRMFDRALALDLPQLLVSTTPLDRAAEFYAPSTSDSAAAEPSAERLAASLRGWLGVDELDPGASLYELGADSLTLLDLIAEVKAQHGVELDLSQLSHRVSLAEVLALLGEEPTGDAVAVEVWQEGTGRDVLSLVHPVGGDIQAYRALVSALDPRLTVCLIADPAFRKPGLPSWSIPERARRYRAALEARFPRAEWNWRLGGWSFGAWVALEMAAGVDTDGSAVDGLYLIDPPAPDAGPHLAAYGDAELEAVFANELSQGEASEAYAKRLAACCRANLATMADYAPPRLSRTTAAVWLAGTPVAGLPVHSTGPEPWLALLPGMVTTLDTTHYGIVEPDQAKVVAEFVNAALPAFETC
ncbi:non-ribosomal peptide synthetase [Amycolatopsis sp. CA-230715]|uniref:non-ribosomal peptide synthetase n=1 Tax=Amycolatopsis sp. CA-230715 TaxID=2745196 RepID=UPI001C027FE1|nr:non-ribosomal peptide synthetase [Amycolatopsis sp. CA-230715]QWF85168.1 D-alanine--poly(phosphoribitol) ligase subunit 1 [Amycolatopsis sp. CA-230715]